MEEDSILQFDTLDARYGKLTPNCVGHSNPQVSMLVFTICLTVGCQILLLKVVFLHILLPGILCIIILALLVSLGFSDPGIAFLEQQSSQMMTDLGGGQRVSKYSRFCSICNHPVRQSTRHCNICGVCVIQYDHHCVFIGKCVGGNNVGRFKLFVALVFGTLGYGIYVAASPL